MTLPGEAGSHPNVVPVERWSPEWHRRLRQVIATLPGKPPLEAAAIRRRLGEDPVAFAVLYLEAHVKGKETGDAVTFAEFHYDWAREALSWREPVTEPMEHRDAYIAPRSAGKSSWWFLIIPLWAAANGYVEFVAAYANAASQAEGHLQTMRRELDTNPLLRHDYPDLCAPARRQSGTTVADRQNMIHTASGFTFAAKGMDSATLGLKVGATRPSVLIIDDAEPDEASYSAYLAKKRLGTLIDAIFALNIYARVVMVGTVTMPGSVAHQLVKHAAGIIDDNNEWVTGEQITVHHHKPILVNDDGTERSCWPEKWPLPWLVARRDSPAKVTAREFRKNYANDPAALEGDYWSSDDIRYGTLGTLATRWMLQLDPAVTTKGSSDWTGLTVTAYRPPLKRRGDAIDIPAAAQAHIDGLPEWMDPFEGQCEIVHASQVRLAGENLRREVLRLIARYQRIRVARVETNQGGETWRTVLHDLPAGVRLVEHTSKVSKEARFAAGLVHWQESRVIHREKWSVLEEQMTGFPDIPFDDVVDSAVHSIDFFLSERRSVQAGVRRSSYA